MKSLLYDSPSVDTLRYFGGLPPAILFFTMGLSHFTHHNIFVALIPPWIPLSSLCVYLTGMFQICGALGLATLPFFDSALASHCCCSLAFLVLLMSPANVYSYTNDVPIAGQRLDYSWTGHGLQFLLLFIVEIWLLTLAIVHKNRPPLRERIRGFFESQRNTGMRKFSATTQIKRMGSLDLNDWARTA